MLRLVPLLLLALASGCSYSVHQLYVSSMDPDVKYGKAKWVEAETKQFVVLGFEFGSDYVENAYKELAGKCSGRIAQVTTEHQTAYLFLSYDQKVILKGLCVKG
jgi:hypothetical protein